MIEYTRLEEEEVIMLLQEIPIESLRRQILGMTIVLGT
jgi:hypothetical protein